MGIPSVFNTGRTGMMASKAAIATTGHNISNANTPGYSRQRVLTESTTPDQGPGSKNVMGTGTQIARVERINDEYLDRQVRNGAKDLAHFEEKDMALNQAQDIFNESNGDGLSRLISRFFNEFRKLSSEPENQAIRESVREASQSMVNDFKRLRNQTMSTQDHIDSRLAGYVTEINALGEEIKDLNSRIRSSEVSGGSANDLKDKRDLAIKKLASYMDISTHQDGNGNLHVDIVGVGPFVAGPIAEKFSVERTKGDDQGKRENTLSLKTTATARSDVTHQIKGGKLGALLEVRDKTLANVLTRLDDLAYAIGTSVNQVHRAGYTRDGATNIDFFAPLAGPERAAESLSLSDAVRSNVRYIATAAEPDSPGDNRVAIAIAGIQNIRMMDGGKVTVDDWYNSIVSDIGVASSRAKSSLNQQRDIVTQLNKMRDQISGVSIDEETANLMQFQHTFDASAKVIQVADEMLKTILELKRY